ncbi:linoleate 9S-lipoxygenase 5-like [Carya illinoinensis]|uniref:linoleate 9S-lipoxygenase 5-like n=1 Tax=Carya illinoinensis TaxID=32201 RepID=UPI001C721623|nr:linoleate 9S-lipoxygenase 5-like [Carya illinoinensis]
MFSSNRSHAVEEWVKGILKKGVPEALYREVIHASKKNPLKFPLPQIIAENGMAWLDDEKFGHQMLAGINPTRIQCLEVSPPQDKIGVRSSIKRSHIEHNLGDLTVVEAMNQWNQWRLFILDHHDYLMPYISRINTKGVCVYASRTLLFLRSDDTLKPIAIELSLTGSNDGNEINRVFVPSSQGTGAALWQLAKAHVATNDSVYHHLISHWLQTHAIVEPFIIATRRQLSEMHPIHRLLNPHFKDTMHINALARRILINSRGILEKILFSGEVSMELSSELYKLWRFDKQGLPADLVKRSSWKNSSKGMALEDEDPNNPTGVQLLFEDYPYGADGLEIWTAIKTWVTEFCSIFYEDDNSVETDLELQAWWWEIQYVGHGDKCHEEWWYQMTTCSTLIETLTILIWIASAIHASVNFGQYTYAGYPSNRPTLCRKFIPKEGTFEYAEFLKDPDKYYLKMLPDTFEMSIGVALKEVLSWHTSDEVYLGQRPSEWTDNEEVRQKFEKFNGTLKEIEGKIVSRNGDPKLKNRWGPAKVPFNCLYPDTSNIASKVGITGKGIPNSISI